VIDGFETPYGMELLSSVHWVTAHATAPATNASEAVAQVRDWNSRKQTLFREEHMRTAWDRLVSVGWISEATQAHSSGAN